MRSGERSVLSGTYYILHMYVDAGFQNSVRTRCRLGAAPDNSFSLHRHFSLYVCQFQHTHHSFSARRPR